MSKHDFRFSPKMVEKDKANLCIQFALGEKMFKICDSRNIKALVGYFSCLFLKSFTFGEGKGQVPRF